MQFTIVEDLGTRVALDDEFHFARIRLSTGEVVPASFSQSQFAKLKDERGPIRGNVTGQVFDQAPTSYNTSDNIDHAVRMDQQAIQAALDAYDRELQDVIFGRSKIKTRPAFPDLEAIPHWVDDFKLHAWGAPSQAGAVMHLALDQRDLNLANESRRSGPPAEPVRYRSRIARALSLYREIDSEFEEGLAALRADGIELGTMGRLLLIFVAAGVAIHKRRQNNATQVAQTAAVVPTGPAGAPLSVQHLTP